MLLARLNHIFEIKELNEKKEQIDEPEESSFMYTLTARELLDKNL
jgi:hypothetical protein